MDRKQFSDKKTVTLYRVLLCAATVGFFCLLVILGGFSSVLASLAATAAVLWLTLRGDKLRQRLGACQPASDRDGRLRLALSGSDTALFEYDARTGLYIDFANSSKLVGRSKEELNSYISTLQEMPATERLQQVAQYFYHPQDADYSVQQMLSVGTVGQASFVSRLVHANGSYLWCKVYLMGQEDESGTVTHVLGLIVNIDTLKRQEECFRQQAEKDGLTGFYNKGAAISLVSNTLDKQSHKSHVMMVLDIDNFKSVNDSMGHMVGDAVIAESAERVRGLFRSDDILGRVGGDEFIVFISGVQNREQIMCKAKQIIDAFYTISINSRGILNISVSIGLYLLVGGQPASFEEMFCCADKALYEAKHRGKNCFVFYDELGALSACSSGGEEKWKEYE